MCKSELGNILEGHARFSSHGKSEDLCDPHPPHLMKYRAPLLGNFPGISPNRRRSFVRNRREYPRIPRPHASFGLGQRLGPHVWGSSLDFKVHPMKAKGLVCLYLGSMKALKISQH
jgi:hypothetical protein